MYRALNNFDSRITTTDYAADFTHTFKNNEARVFDVSYKLSRSNASNKIAFAREPSYNNESSHGESSYSDQQDDYYLQVNYAQPFKQHLIEIGISDTRRVTNSESSPINSVFDFGEKVKAAYASFKLKFNRWLVTNEGRWEKADTRFTLSSGESQHNTYSYFIPNISISGTVIKNSVIRFGYSQRVTRPDISYLDPFVNNADAFNLSYGNPFLKPTLSHAVNLTFTTTIRKLFFSVNASHQFTHNTIEQITRVGVDTISRTTYENTGLYSSSAAGMSVSGLLLKKITINMNSAINYVRFGDQSLSKTGIHSGITYNTGITTTTHFKRWTIAAYASYVSPLLSAQGTSSSTFITNSFTISRRFLDKKNLTLALSVFEPFVGKRISVMEFGDAQFSVMQRLTTVTRQVNMSLNYRFARIKAE